MVKKILCICDWGNVRSVAMAQFIKELNGKYKDFINHEAEIKYEAIAIGAQVTTKETMEYMMDWADIYIDTTALGKDVWHKPRHPELKKKMEEVWKSEKH